MRSSLGGTVASSTQAFSSLEPVHFMLALALQDTVPSDVLSLDLNAPEGGSQVRIERSYDPAQAVYYRSDDGRLYLGLAHHFRFSWSFGELEVELEAGKKPPESLEISRLMIGSVRPRPAPTGNQHLDALDDEIVYAQINRKIVEHLDDELRKQLYAP